MTCEALVSVPFRGSRSEIRPGYQELVGLYESFRPLSGFTF